MSRSEDALEMPALGRPFQLGMLYDCRKDALIPGITLWDLESLQKDVSIRPQPKTEFEIIASDSIDDKASALNVSASLKASFLGGLVEVGGSAKYFQGPIQTGIKNLEVTGLIRMPLSRISPLASAHCNQGHFNPNALLENSDLRGRYFPDGHR